MAIELLNCRFDNTSDSAYYFYNSNGLNFIQKGSTTRVYSPYIELPSATTYQYDFLISAEQANNTIYLQVERFNENKESITNNAALACINGLTPSSDLIYVRYKGTLNLATFGSGSDVQNTKYIRVRIFNNYGSSKTGTFILHSWSIKAINNDLKNTQIMKNGQILSESFRESNTASISKNGFVDSANFYEY